MIQGLSAAWTGAWTPPWPLAGGRRWGDRAWALAVIAQAWLLGGREGRWPRARWRLRRPGGPGLEGAPEGYASQPDAAWVALLRHGSLEADARRSGPREDPVQRWVWEALLEGDGSPWMAYGTVLLDRRVRTRWVPLLGAVDGTGRLHLPPFLESLVPEPLGNLPPGWWAALLGSMDASGRLLPEGDPPPAEQVAGLAAHAPLMRGLAWRTLPAALQAWQGSPWLHHADGWWVADPRFRAWVRGLGACPEALQDLEPAALAQGDAPGPRDEALLKGTMPPELPEGWAEVVARDLAGLPPEAEVLPSGDATLDRLAVRWGSPEPRPLRGYPSWDLHTHPCADPFHWIAKGFQAVRAVDSEAALRAFGWAWAHFTRLRAPFWARRAAINASSAAALWGDLSAARQWYERGGPQEGPLRALDEAEFKAAEGDMASARALARRAAEGQPDNPRPWFIQAALAAEQGDMEELQRLLPFIRVPVARRFLEEYLAGFPNEPEEGFPSDLHMEWQVQRVHRGLEPLEAVWPLIQACPNRPAALHAGLGLLEAFPQARTPARLAEMQVLAGRIASPLHLERIARLWPSQAEGGRPQDAEALVVRALRRRSGPAWIWIGTAQAGRLLGPEAPPPPGLLERLRCAGGFDPVLLEGHVWRGFPLQWQAATVGAVLASLDPGKPTEAFDDLVLLAPWVARLIPQEAPPRVEAGRLLTDGSEPMASVLRELERVAPAPLPVLILGPTGSGKELAAQELHRRSGRPGPLVPVNCSAFVETLMESELFGHVKGAFTGADRDRRGAIEAAEGGTLFLDEVADLSPRLQSLFLRVLQEREVRRVGSDRSARVDVRFVAATHKNLEALAASGLFRRDLLYRLEGATLRLPSLRERRHEFPYLVPRLLQVAAAELGRPAPCLEPGLSQALGRLPWEGNFRELRHALDRALLRCGEGPLGPGHFPELQRPAAKARTWQEATRAFQRGHLLETLRRARFNAADAADHLGLARPALYPTAKRLGLDLAAERQRWEAEAHPDPSRTEAP